MIIKLSDYINPTPKQREAFKYVGKGYRIFYGGARGGGKSHFSLMAAVYCCLNYPGIKCVLIRETYPELEDNFINALQDLYPAQAFGYKYRGNPSRTARFNNGSRIIFRACDCEAAAKKIQGIEFQIMIVDEANNFDEMTLHKLTGSLRVNVSRIPNFEPTLIMTGNPGGVSDVYFKTRFVRPNLAYWKEYEIKHQDKYKFISAKVSDNPYVNESYIDWLGSLPTHLKEAWLEGNWDVFEGQFFEEWNSDEHIVEHYEPPEHWYRYAGLDLGFTREHPTVCLWAAQNPDNYDVYVYREYSSYGVTEQYISDIKDIQGREPITAIYADPSMFNSSLKHRFDDDSPDLMFLKNGLPITPANNNRANGWRVLKQWLHWTTNRTAKLKISEQCPVLIQTMPTLKYAQGLNGRKDDLNTKGQDDAADALRYLLITAFGYPSEYEIKMMSDEQKEKKNNRDFTQAVYSNFLTEHAPTSAYYL